MTKKITCKPSLAGTMLASLDARVRPGNHPAAPKGLEHAHSIARLATHKPGATRVSNSAQGIIILLLTLLSFCGALAQTGPSAIKRVTGHIGVGGSSQQGSFGSLGLQTVTSKGLTVSLSYINLTATPKNLPEDYDAGYIVFFLFPIPNSNPEVELSLVSATVGKTFEAARNFWFSAGAGLSLVKGAEYSFHRQEVTSDFWGSKSPNYAATPQSKSTVGALLQADATWAFSSFAGLGLGVFANLNAIQSPVGAEFKLVMGWMNRPPKKKA